MRLKVNGWVSYEGSGYVVMGHSKAKISMQVHTGIGDHVPPTMYVA